jgi:PKD repeat protein
LRNPTHTYTTAGAKTVTLTVTNTLGSNSTNRAVTVLAALTASFTFSPASPAVGQSVQFTDTSTGAPSIWQWNFGDGVTSVAQNPTHSFASAGSYTVTLTIMNASTSNTTSRAVVVGTSLTASFTYSPASPTTGQTVQFTDTSAGSPTSWSWNFGDGGTSTSRNPSHAYSASGTYAVNLTVATTSNSQTTSMPITVTPPATLEASFSFSPSSPAPGQTVAFSDTSTGAPTSWQWNFGDGGTSAVQNPSHSYASEGSYTVTLIAGNSSGSDTVSRTFSVAEGSDIIPADRLYDWGSYSGVPGGIPARTAIYTTLTSSATASQIAAAVAACPAGQVVRLSAGSYNVGTLAISSANQCTLRGDGAGRTIINGSIGLNGGWFPTSADSWASPSAIASGYTKGSTTITLSTTPGASFAVGNLIQITQNDDYDLVWHREGNYAGTKNLRFTSRITGVSGNNISLATPIPYSYSARLSPICMAIAASNRLFGVENLTINGSVPVSMTGADRCWFKDVEMTGFDNAGITSYNSIQCEIQRCYFHDAAGFPSSDGYFILHQYGNSCWRIEDNIAARCTMLIFNSSSACFVGYNLSYDSRRAAQPLIQPSFNSNHGPHSIMNLWEGNIGQRFTNDGYHGSGSHDMIFRNNFHGTNTATGWTNERRLIDLVKGSYYESVVGNVLGDPSYTPTSYQAYLMAAHSESFCYVLGWAEGGSADARTYTVPWTNWTASFPDVKVEANLFRHANYDYYHRATIYQNGVSQAIPSSLFYASRPSYFGSLQWPPIGPDVSGFVTNIPAQARWAAYLSSGSLADLFR